ncbi:hypothetical protein JHK84_052528 [Glycine max]|nr:hypothetical protein JHK84_052528 [Glycine max]
MGIVDAMLDIVSSGTTLIENNLKEIKGGDVLESQIINSSVSLWQLNALQAVFITSRKSMIQQKGVLETTHEMLERLEAHLRAIGQFKMHSLYFPIPPLLHQDLIGYCKHEGKQCRGSGRENIESTIINGFAGHKARRETLR